MRSEFTELEKLLKIHAGPRTDGKDFVQISCHVDFEPHGIASETWEVIWFLQLPQIPHHWPSTTGWRKGTTDKPISFSGRTLSEVIIKATVFLKETKQQGVKV